ncbi:hypothetical protein B0I37DRAFT_394807 [Chaetomium sp. MPI-CAGE-AT-0009]|nr:hypothetical protein B0I37DRAFT_394807 [Chaetomium sp. MPI-CAGE-AT-0009]
MCIKLIRHYQCSTTVEHVCEYIIRCSNPTYMIEDLVGLNVPGRRRRPCLDEGTLESREEWYEQACPDCSGENVAPRTECVRAVDHGIPGRDDEYRHRYFNDPDSVPDDDAVSVYAQNLAFWLLASMHMPGRRFDVLNPMTGPGPMGDESNPLVMDERRMYVLNELICQVYPEHGCLCKLGLDESAMQEGRREFGHQLPSRGCPCFATQKPWLCNWATHFRREAARDLWLRLTSTEDRLDAELAYNLQERTFLQCAVLGKAAAATKGEASPEALPVLEVWQPPRDAIADRDWILGRDARLMVSFCEDRHFEEEPEKEEGVIPEHEKNFLRLEARASLLPWATFILMHDSGLTIRRAREILAFFAARVLRYNPEWREFKPQLLAYDACDRLKVLANERPDDVADWAWMTLAPFLSDPDVDKILRLSYVVWQQRDRQRVSAVCRNMVAATKAEFEALRESGDTRCPICFEDFDDHVSALSTHPVQNRRCYERGHRHWLNAACLVRFARTLLNADDEDAAPGPRCPICLTEFGDCTSEE